MHEYMKILVVENKLVDYQYFMDEMQLYEIFDLIDLLPWANKTSFEQMRLVMWATLKPYLKRQSTTPEKLFPLYTDTHTSEKIIPEHTEAEIEAMRRQILEIYKNKNNG